MTATMVSGGTESTLDSVDEGCTSNNSTPPESACYDSDEILMNAKRTLTLVVTSAALIAWLAGAATSNREIASVPIVTHTPIDARGENLSKEIARLHERLRPDATPRQPGRNLFTFHSGARAAAPSMPEAPKAALVEAPPPMIAPSLKLVGLAEDDGPDGAVRSAIISGDGELFIVKVGDSVTARYVVTTIGADVVELTDVTDHTIRRLPLR